MKFDLRYPVGILFTIYGLLLGGYGLFSNKEIYARSLNMNVNLVWGAVMLVFGVIMLVMAIKAKKQEK
jgi:multisubunit Na+/H+ antiporter MnhG subunit